MAQIEVRRRAGGYTDRARAYRVKVDGEELGRVSAGQTAQIEVSPGSHEVLMQVDWAKSPPIAVETSDAAPTKLYCEPNANPLTVLWYAVVARNRYIALEVDTGQ